MPREAIDESILDLKELGTLLTKAAVKSPAVVDAPAKTAPDKAAVEKAVIEVAKVVAPTVAPNVPKAAVTALAKEVATQVVSSPAVVKAGAGSTVSSATVSQIANNATAKTTTYLGEPLPNVTTGVTTNIKSGSSPLPNVTTGVTTDVKSGATPMSTASTSKSAVTTSTSSPAITKPVSQMTQAEIDAITAKQIAMGGSANDQSLTIPGETNAQRSARLVAGYKNMLAQPILSDAAKKAGATVEYVRTEAGGVGSYTVVYPAGYAGPKETTTQWTAGIIPSNSPYTKGTTLGVYSKGDGTYTAIDGVTPITIASTTQTSTSAVTSKITTSAITTSFTTSPTTTVVTTNPVTSIITSSLTAAMGLTAADVTRAVTDAVNALNTSWQAKFDALTNQQKTQNQAITTSAIEDFRANLRLAGLGDLADTIDGFIKQDLTASQIKIELTKTQAYERRFPGMKALMQAGQAINEATYINMEKGMLNVLSAYGLDEKTLGTREKLGEVIANQVSVAEYESRVQMAADRIKKNTDVLASLNQYYGVDTAGAMSYLLDPKLGMDIVKKQIRASEIGAAAQMYQFDLSKAEAESYINVSGTSDLNTLKESFGKARLLATTQTRLSAIEGEKYNELESVATVLGQDYQRQLESQRRALREAARFAGQSGVSTAALRSESGI